MLLLRREHKSFRLNFNNNSTATMKPTLWKLTLVTACVCASGLAARAAALQRSDVSADPAWLLRLDCVFKRASAFTPYIDPIKNARKNLTIEYEACATRLL